MQCFAYGEREINHLKARDAVLGRAIDRIGHIDREVNPDLFESLVNCIVGQQIATKAHQTIWNRMKTELNAITPQTIDALSAEEIQRFGISFRKAGYIKNAAANILNGELDLYALYGMEDDTVCKQLSGLKGVGIWTAEMLMTFSMQRPDVMSYGDLAIHRGLRMLYHHRRIDKRLFEKYRRRYAPYASVACLYLWAIAGGAIPGMRDYAPAKSKS